MALVPFDRQAWKRRAWARCERAGQTQAAERKFHSVSHAIDGLGRLVTWAEARGVRIEFDPTESEGSLLDNVASISSRVSAEKQLCYLLHELGHHLIGVREPDQRFGAGYGDETPGATRTSKHRLAVVEEELEAWHRGMKLAHRLGIRVNVELFDRLKLAAIKTYMSWCLRQGRFVTQ